MKIRAITCSVFIRPQARSGDTSSQTVSVPQSLSTVIRISPHKVEPSVVQNIPASVLTAKYEPNKSTIAVTLPIARSNILEKALTSTTDVSTDCLTANRAVEFPKPRLRFTVVYFQHEQISAGVISRKSNEIVTQRELTASSASLQQFHNQIIPTVSRPPNTVYSLVVPAGREFSSSSSSSAPEQSMETVINLRYSSEMTPANVEITPPSADPARNHIIQPIIVQPTELLPILPAPNTKRKTPKKNGSAVGTRATRLESFLRCRVFSFVLFIHIFSPLFPFR